MDKVLNFNCYVKVKLTEYGLELHYRNYLDFYERIGKAPTYAYIPPKIDEEGFSSFQMWNLMKIYGPYMYLGMKGIFEEGLIHLPEKELKDK